MFCSLLAVSPGNQISLISAWILIVACVVLLVAVFVRSAQNTRAQREQREREKQTAVPAPEKSASEGSVAEEPVSEEPVAEGPASEGSVAEEPVSEEPVAEEPASEGSVAEEPAVGETVAEEPASEEPVAEEPASEGSVAERRVVYASEDGWFVNIRYDRSFEAKLIQGDEQLKRYYSVLKNELLSYQKISARTSWQHESFRRGRVTVAKLVVRGKTLRLYLALDPAAYGGSKYLVEDVSEHSKFEKTPLLYRIKNDRRCRYAKDLIAAAMAQAEAVAGEAQNADYAAIPYETTEALIERGLVRVIEVRRRAEDGEGAVAIPDDEDDAPEPAAEETFETAEEREDAEGCGVAAEDETDAEAEAAVEETLFAEPEEVPAGEVTEGSVAEDAAEAETPAEESAAEDEAAEEVAVAEDAAEAETPAEESADEVEEEAAEAAEPEPEPEPVVSLAEAEQRMGDEEAETYVEISEHMSLRGKQAIVNVDTLGAYFENGETVTIAEMRTRIPFFNKRATSVKVLARGVLTKRLEVEADDFSLSAVKMIVLMGGKVYRTRR